MSLETSVIRNEMENILRELDNFRNGEHVKEAERIHKILREKNNEIKLIQHELTCTKLELARLGVKYGELAIELDTLKEKTNETNP